MRFLVVSFLFTYLLIINIIHKLLKTISRGDYLQTGYARNLKFSMVVTTNKRCKKLCSINKGYTKTHNDPQ